MSTVTNKPLVMNPLEYQSPRRREKPSRAGDIVVCVTMLIASVFVSSIPIAGARYMGAMMCAATMVLCACYARSRGTSANQRVWFNVLGAIAAVVTSLLL